MPGASDSGTVTAAPARLPDPSATGVSGEAVPSQVKLTVPPDGKPVPFTKTCVPASTGDAGLTAVMVIVVAKARPAVASTQASARTAAAASTRALTPT